MQCACPAVRRAWQDQGAAHICRAASLLRYIFRHEADALTQLHSRHVTTAETRRLFRSCLCAPGRLKAEMPVHSGQAGTGRAPACAGTELLHPRVDKLAYDPGQPWTCSSACCHAHCLKVEHGKCAVRSVFYTVPIRETTST